MIDVGMKEQLRNIDDRLARVEQILPSLATKDDLKAFATKDELKAFATKDDLKPFVTKDQLDARVATLATKDDLKETEERLRRHFNVVAEAFKAEVHLVIEGNMATTSRVETLERKHERLDERVTRLEDAAPRRRR